MDRRRILGEAELLAAPRACQEAFWVHRNRAARRRGAVRLGEVATKVVDDAALAGAGHVVALTKAWKKLLPQDYSGLTMVEQYRNGQLLVTVDSAATKYALSRRLGEKFISALNEATDRFGPPRTPVRRIAFRVGLTPGTKGGVEMRGDESGGAG